MVTDNVELLVPFSQDKTLIKQKLDLLVKRVNDQQYGYGMQYSALMATLNELFNEEDKRRIIIFQTDGGEATFIAYKPPNPTENQKRFNFEEMYAKIGKLQVTVYSVIPGFSLLGVIEEDRIKKTQMMVKKNWGLNETDEARASGADTFFREQKSMDKIARISGGFTKVLEKPEQADEIYSAIFNGITQRYLIGYYSTNPDNARVTGNVKIEVREHPDYLVWRRQVYDDPE